MGLGAFMTYDVSPTDPCGSLILDKTDPNGGGQTFELEHFGPDGTTVFHMNINVADDAFFHCWGEAEGRGNEMHFPDGAGRRATLDCRLVLAVEP